MDYTEWKPDTNYKKLDKVFYFPYMYFCVKDHTSKADQNPSVETTYWRQDETLTVSLLGPFEINI